VPSAYQFDVNGAGRFSSFCSATNYITTSDKRIKQNISDANLAECTRLVQAVHPKTYSRIDMDKALSGGYRCIMGASEDKTGPLLALDYFRVVVVLHGALLSALARLEALESRL
jgi:hypothetical protein